jgi:hypothetical protein
MIEGLIGMIGVGLLAAAWVALERLAARRGCRTCEHGTTCGQRQGGAGR